MDYRPDDQSNDSTPPEVPDFDLLRLIGEGGFGQVWLATNRATGHLRAVKVIALHRSGMTDPAGREITSLTRLEANLRRSHPNLLSIHHVGKTADHLFYVMDPADDVSGSRASASAGYRPATLEGRLADGPLPPEECLRYSRELLMGLASLHEAGMVHRDVKPANCLFVDGELKLADFGLLTEAHPQVSRVGTQKYMPPDGRMDTRADVYAAGLVIYEMITGLPADDFPRLGDRAEQIAQTPGLCALTRLALGACQPDPQQRFQDAGTMLGELSATDPEAADPETAAARSRSRRSVVALAAGGAVVLSLGAAGWWWATRPPPVHVNPVHVNRVHVNFVTEPYEAIIYLDDTLLVDAQGNAYTTPCTVESLPARAHHVLFEHPRQTTAQDAGMVDFAEIRQVTARWDSGQ
ncbi:MAG: hypothetical protein A2V70_04210 [Planctomycetes bacterium RBG_13_63_9]|nr:MAG: hypothetical protein A2V70_04210 [Planctomycetes bacterium RBG_13_63_9]